MKDCEVKDARCLSTPSQSNTYIQPRFAALFRAMPLPGALAPTQLARPLSTLRSCQQQIANHQLPRCAIDPPTSPFEIKHAQNNALIHRNSPYTSISHSITPLPSSCTQRVAKNHFIPKHLGPSIHHLQKNIPQSSRIGAPNLRRRISGAFRPPRSRPSPPHYHHMSHGW